MRKQNHSLILKKVVWIACIVMAGGIPAASAGSSDPNPPTLHSNQGAWPIHRQWTPGEAEHYAKWVEHIYEMKTEGTVEQRMAKLEGILTDPEMNLLLDPHFLGEGANPQLPERIIRHVHNMLDCAKLTAFFPAYYAYRRALPWMTTWVRSGDGGDVRTADHNIPSGTASNFNVSSLYEFFSEGIGGFSSGNYRVELNSKNAGLSDTVPVSISKKYLLPGCVNYVDGHCLLVGDITPYGEVRFINASTTKTREIYTYNGMNAVAGITPRGHDEDNEWGGCFQGFRVPRYPIAETTADGRVVRIRRRTNEEMKEFGFSTEQYELARSMREHHRIKDGGLVARSLHDLIRLRLMSVDEIEPVAFMEKYADEVEEVYRLRGDFVQGAWQNVQENGPIQYPEDQEDENIFQAYGRWETWSSPSSDVDRRNKYFYLGEWMDFAIRAFGASPDFLNLKGLDSTSIRSQLDLAKALVKKKNEIFDRHGIHYTNSVGEKVYLSLNQVEKRLYDLSFDPNHPPELRWGAPEGSEERASAPETFTPVPGGERVAMERGYKLQAYYRTVCTRETEPSYLRQMFTDGYPIRSKIDEQLSLWSYADKPTDAILAWLETGEEPTTDLLEPLHEARR